MTPPEKKPEGMKIAILGWGSLVWDPRELPVKGICKCFKWKKGGPSLKIEFSKISANGRLTLVIDPNGDPDDHPRPVPTRYAVSKRNTLEDAICDLRHREGTNEKNIGYTNLRSGQSRCQTGTETLDIIKAWAQKKKFDAVIWTDLKSKFRHGEINTFTLDNAVDYLRTLPDACQENAREYICKAPREVETPLRRRLATTGWLDAGQ